MRKILVAGGTGLIGSNLITKLKQKNYKIVLLTTQKDKADGITAFYWNPVSGELPPEALKDVEVCINLCGAGIFDKRFTDQRKKELIDSRIIPTQFLLQSFNENKISLKQYISSSGIGFYENICSDILTEDSTKGSGFISDLVEEWEGSARKFESGETTVAIVRTGIVFSEKGGFMKQLLAPILYFVGSVPGNGQQMVSWIHIDDLTDMMIYLFENNIGGVFNATADQPEQLKTVTRQVAKAVKRPLFLPNIPEFILKLLFGGQRAALIMTSQKVSNEKIKSKGFRFHYDTSDQAIKNLLNK